MSEVYRRLQKNKVEYKLSILILSLPNRLDKLIELMKDLNKQSINKPVQILYLGDNKSMSVGDKRNLALTMPKGKYITFIDDDDKISSDYIEKILEAIENNPEVITFKVQKTTNGTHEKEHRYYLNNGPTRLSPDRSHYKMNPNHLCVWRKDIIQEVFPDKDLSEDHIWASEMTKHYSSIHEIDEILYFYLYNKETSETH